MIHDFAVRCRRCDYEKDYYLGAGLIHPGPPELDGEDALLPRLAGGEETERIRAMLADGGRFESDYCFAVWRCPTCGAFAKVFDYRVIGEDGRVKGPQPACAQCKTELERVDLDNPPYDEWECPQCHNHSLTKGQSWLTPWDD